MEFNFLVSPSVIFGVDKTNEIGKMLKDLGRKKTMLVCDKSMIKLGFVQRIQNILSENDIQSVIFDKVMPNPTDTLIHDGANFAKLNKIDSFIGIGGGSVMDSTKAINIIVTNGGKIKDYEGANLVKNAVLPSILIATTSGTASEITSVSVITDSTNHKKMVIAGQNVTASIAVCDPALTFTLPKNITASTGMDALTHAIEAYVSTLASPVTDVLAIRAIELIISNLEEAVCNSSKESRENMMLGSLMAGMAFNSALLGLVHSLAHPLSAHYDTPHGVANAIFLPNVMEYNLDSIGPKILPLAKAMGLSTEISDTNLLGNKIVNKLRSLSKSIEIPSLESLDISHDSIATLAEDALAELSTMTNPKGVSKEILIDLILKTLKS